MFRPVIAGARASAASIVAAALIAVPAAGQGPAARDSAARDSARRLPPVRVVAERAPRPEAASGVVAPAQAIRTVPATNVWDIVRQTAGVEVHQQGQGPGFASNAVLRGFTSDHSTDVALVVDGVPANQPINGHSEGYADWGVLLPEAVADIRVLKGPVSPFIGPFAMGGELEVHTLPMAAGTRWSARGGSYGDARLSLVTGGVTARGGYVLAGDAQREDGWRPNARARTGHLLLNRLWTSAGGASFSLGATAYAANWRSPGFLTLDDFERGALRQAVDPTDGGHLENGTVRGTASRRAGGGTVSSLLFARVSRWLLFLNIPPEGGIGEGAPSQTEDSDRRVDGGGYTRYSRETGFGDLTVGLDYHAVDAGFERYFTTRRARDSAFALVDGGYLLLAPTAEAHVNVGPALTLGVGGRVDRLAYRSRPRGDGGERASAAHVVATPKLSALLRLSPAVSAYAAFNGGFRAADGVIGEPSLEPIREWASEVGLRAEGRRFEGSAALFDVEVRNEQTFNPVTLTASARGRSRRRGVEVDARVGVIPAVALFGHATVNDAHFLELVNDEGESLAGEPVFGVSRATVEAGADFERRGLLGSVWAAYTGPFTPFGEPGGRADAFTLVHARVLVPLGGPWSLGVGVQNLLDDRYTELRASGFVSPGQPRTVLVTLRHGG
ncbi:MAG TPA: TonB-dependent receptor [Gemmatimonadaceae bacterium]|nr:TonB-dependent receptor [Gemmatimonadaceae bacterium]